jgi:hypothetical protein
MTLRLDALRTRQTAPSEVTSGFDEHLGAAERRYLGTGHRRVALEVQDLQEDGPTAFSTTASLQYPSDWSQKDGQTREPHLSTVDAIRVAEYVRTVLVGKLPWLAAFAEEQALTVRAGANAWADLDAVPVRVTIEEQPAEGRVRLCCKIGSLRVESTWERAPQRQSVGGETAGKASEITLDGDNSVSCTYARPEQHVTMPIPFLEALMLTAQMSQVVLYAGDVAERERSGNMWMRRASFERRTVAKAPEARVALQLRNRRTLSIEGRFIGTADVLAEDVFGVYVTASLAMGS